MKMVIDGKKYNTETATEVAENARGHRGDFHHYEETLYVSPRGNWFLAGHGGPMSKYAESCGQNEWRGSATIIPLTRDEAQEWLEAAGEVEKLEKYFKDNLEDA